MSFNWNPNTNGVRMDLSSFRMPAPQASGNGMEVRKPHVAFKFELRSGVVWHVSSYKSEVFAMIRIASRYRPSAEK